jgi:hypothetical protein
MTPDEFAEAVPHAHQFSSRPLAQRAADRVSTVLRIVKSLTRIAI